MVGQMRSTAPLAGVLVALLALVGAAACGRDHKPAAEGTVSMAGEEVTTSRLLTVAAGICDAAALAARDNVNSSRATFFGQSHDGLHLIARGLQASDRAQSAALLEAKQKVEADFVAPPPGTGLADDLRRLADVTRDSLARFKVSADACPPS
jgi:hypothetical protein